MKIKGLKVSKKLLFNQVFKLFLYVVGLKKMH